MEPENSNSAAPSANPDSHQLSPEDDFYSGAAARLPRFMAAIGLVLTAAAWWKFGRAITLGFLGGSIIAFLNFHWLKTGVTALADRATNSGQSQSSTGIIFRFLLRYVLMGAAAYGILTSFPASLRGLLAGLFLPVGAIACEAAYETFVALTRRN
jgi:hypothetical protein